MVFEAHGMTCVILLERVICFPCLSEYRHQPISALHIPCTAWNITFISMICHFRCCPRLFLHNTCRTSDGSAGGWPRTWAGICKCWGVTISDPDCYVTVGVMFWFTYFSVVFYIHEISIRRRKQWCLRLTVCHTELLSFNYAKVNTVFHSMAPLRTILRTICTPGAWPDSQLVAGDFLSKKSSIVWCHCDYLSAPDRDGVSPNSNLNIKHVWYLRLLIGLPLMWYPR